MNGKMRNDGLYTQETYDIIGAAIEVQKIIGTGFQEPIYQEALALEFNARNIPFEREKELTINYKGIELNKKYYADFVCFGKIILELKTVDHIIDEHYSQVLNYLNITFFTKTNIIIYSVFIIERIINGRISIGYIIF